VKFTYFAAFLGLVLWGSACANDTRFPICKTDAECAAREDNKGNVLCENLRCVQCRYDNDCPGGSYCENKTQACREISPKQKEDLSVFTEDYKTYDDCIKACQDSACTDVCSARFPDAAKKTKKKTKR
jgi:hypothetical protein